MNITIDESIKAITPHFSVGVIEMEVEVFDNPLLNIEIDLIENEIRDSINIKDVVNLDIIKDGRDAYKKYGKDPSRYRLAVESLYRRLAKGNKLYRINNLVDVGNVLSIKTRKSIAVLDYDKIEGNIKIRLGRDEDVYEGIGRGKINISNIPLYEDDISPFGSVTSDTFRTSISNDTKKVLLFIISFSEKDDLIDEINLAINLYKKYCKANKYNSYIV